MNKRQSYFTLTELMIVLAIILSIAAVVGVGTSRLLQKEHYRASVNLLTDKLQLAQDLMLILKTDVTMKIVKDEAGEFFTLFEIEKPINKKLEKIIEQKTPLKGVESIIFEDATTHVKQDNPIALKFFSKGTKMSKGLLKIVPKGSGEKEKIIVLPGYPKTIGSKIEGDSFRSLINNDEYQDEIYPQDVKKIIEENKTAKEKPVPVA